MKFFKTYSDAEVLIDCLTNNSCHKFDILKILDNNETMYHLLKVHFDERLDYIVDDAIVRDIIDFIEIDVSMIGHLKGSFTGMSLRYETYSGEYETRISGKLYEVLGYYAILTDDMEFFGFFKMHPHVKSFFLKHCR